LATQTKKTKKQKLTCKIETGPTKRVIRRGITEKESKKKKTRAAEAGRQRVIKALGEEPRGASVRSGAGVGIDSLAPFPATGGLAGGIRGAAEAARVE
jgi:hypothetical protein